LGTPSTERSAQGQRTDLSEFAAAVRNGASKRSLAEAFPGTFLKYPRGTAEMQAVFAVHRDSSVPNIVVVYSGGTGTGKTWRAHDELKARFGADGYYVKDGVTKWWDGYDGQKGVLIDDYNGAWPVDYLLAMLHEHPQRVEIKCGFPILQAKMFIITSNKHPTEWYPNADLNHRAALARRITRHVYMETPYHLAVKQEPGTQPQGNSNGKAEVIDIIDE